MKQVQIALLAVLLPLTVAPVQAQSDPLSAIKDAVTSKYSLTTPTADKTNITHTGSVLVLKKNNLITATAGSMIGLSNTYKGGEITQGLMGHMASGTSGTRTFVAGEKLWVTNIDVKNKGIVFTLFSDSIDATHYQTTLTFPFAKGTTPSPAEAMATISEVFDSEGGGNNPPVAALPIDSAQPVPSAQATPVASSQPIDSTPWDPKYGRLTADDIQRINQASVRFDINYLRLNPAALDNKAVMQYFIALNNCNDKDISRALFNELDYPRLAAYYKLKAPQILASLPKTVTDVALYRYIGGQQADGWRMWTQSLNLGEYNVQRKAFPLKYPGKDSVEIPSSLSTEGGSRDLSKGCPAAARAATAANSALPNTYTILLKPAVYKELPLDEDAARKYIDTASQQRNVFLAMDVAILDAPPTITRTGNSTATATFHAQAVRIRVIDGTTLKAVGSLYDDHSLPAEVKVAQAPPPPAQPAQPNNQWAAGDHLYDIRQAVYISLAASACSNWTTLTPEQTANLKVFIDQVSNGKFNEKYQYNMVDTRVRNAINAKGRANYCADPMERRDFDKAARTVAPLGPLAAPAR